MLYFWFYFSRRHGALSKKVPNRSSPCLSGYEKRETGEFNRIQEGAALGKRYTESHLNFFGQINSKGTLTKMYVSKSHSEFAGGRIAFQTHKKRCQTNIFSFAKLFLSMQITYIIFRALQSVKNFFYMFFMSFQAFISLFRTGPPAIKLLVITG
jgi:hypothetical protein